MSANLRTSGNIEQVVIEENSDLYDFNMEFHNNIIETFKTIDKPLNTKSTWHQVQIDSRNTTEKEKQNHLKTLKQRVRGI